MIGHESKLQKKEVHHRDTKDTSPQGWVGSGEGAVGKGENGDDHEEDGDSHHTAGNVIVPVDRVVPRNDIVKMYSNHLTIKSIQPCKGCVDEA